MLYRYIDAESPPFQYLGEVGEVELEFIFLFLLY